MTDKRDARRQQFIAEGRCQNCGDPRDGVLIYCALCRSRKLARNRQRYRPSMQAADWTMAMLARNAAMSVRVL